MPLGMEELPGPCYALFALTMKMKGHINIAGEGTCARKCSNLRFC